MISMVCLITEMGHAALITMDINASSSVSDFDSSHTGDELRINYTIQNSTQNGYFDDDLDSLTLRTTLWAQASTTVAESPPSITRHFVTNIRAYAGEAAGTFQVTSNVLVFRIRSTSSTPHLFSCRRNDLLREVDGELKLAYRLVKMDEPVVQSPNLSFLV